MKKKRRSVSIKSGKNIEAIFLVVPEVLKPFLHVSVARDGDSRAMVFIDITTDYGTDAEDKRLNTPSVLCFPRKELFLWQPGEGLEPFEVEQDMISAHGILSWYLKKREEFKTKWQQSEIIEKSRAE